MSRAGWRSLQWYVSSSLTNHSERPKLTEFAHRMMEQAVLCVLSQREAICLDTSSSAAIEKKRLKEVGNGIHGSEIAMHASRQSCWVVVDGSVYE